MTREKHNICKHPQEITGVLGIQEIENVDHLAQIYRSQGEDANIPTHLIIDIIGKELSSKELAGFLKTMPIEVKEEVSIKEITTLMKNVPKKLYFFLWSLSNSDVIPVKGVLTSLELRKSIYCLTKFLWVLESCLKRTPNSIPLFENLGFAYFDLAGLARFSKRGLLMNGRWYDYPCLLRKAIKCFQCAIKLNANRGKDIDATHQDILSLVTNKCDLDDSRSTLYLNPWHFLYISSALEVLNDKKASELYLRKARTIMNNIDDHQNPKIVAQKELLESVYTTIHYGKSVKFDFGQRNLQKIQKKLKRIQKNKKRNMGIRNGYSPMVEGALSKQYQIEGELRKGRSLQLEQKVYLQGIFSLYRQVISPHDRDKLIFRLNIPPLRLNGLNNSSRVIHSFRPIDSTVRGSRSVATL